MTTSFARKDSGLGFGLSFSTILHLSLFALLTFTHFNLRTPPAEQVYYVDVVNLPVLRPQEGNPAAPPNAAPAPPTPAPSPTRPAEMKLPIPATKVPPGKTPAPAAPSKPATSPAAPETAAEFEKRLATLEREAEERRQSAAFDALRKKIATASATQAGIPKGAGDEAGSDYASYIQSRLFEAFKDPRMLQRNRNMEVMVLLVINRHGRLADYRIERSTGDRVFEDAVARAIAKAERNFRPPPNNANFEHKFLFTPDSVGKK